MEELDFRPQSESQSNVIAVSGPFQIELMTRVGSNDYSPLIQISESLIKEYGPSAKLTPNTIQTYFNREGSLPFIARFQGEIIGYIIGVPLELLSQEPWARIDINFGKYTSSTIFARITRMIVANIGGDNFPFIYPFCSNCHLITFIWAFSFLPT
mgnify:CR=1 FL=1